MSTLSPSTSDLASVAAADTEYCFDCGRLASDVCAECVQALANEPRGFTAGIADVLMGKPMPARTETRCKACDRPIAAREPVRNVLLTDGTRGPAHEGCIWSRELGDGCRHGILPATACVWCNGKQRPVYARSRTFRARKPGSCVLCTRDFSAGALIQRVSTAGGEGWAHAGCVKAGG